MAEFYSKTEAFSGDSESYSWRQHGPTPEPPPPPEPAPFKLYDCPASVIFCTTSTANDDTIIPVIRYRGGNVPDQSVLMQHAAAGAPGAPADVRHKCGYFNFWKYPDTDPNPANRKIYIKFGSPPAQSLWWESSSLRMIGVDAEDVYYPLIQQPFTPGTDWEFNAGEFRFGKANFQGDGTYDIELDNARSFVESTERPGWWEVDVGTGWSDGWNVGYLLSKFGNRNHFITGLKVPWNLNYQFYTVQMRDLPTSGQIRHLRPGNVFFNTNWNRQLSLIDRRWFNVPSEVQLSLDPRLEEFEPNVAHIVSFSGDGIFRRVKQGTLDPIPDSWAFGQNCVRPISSTIRWGTAATAEFPGRLLVRDQNNKKKMLWSNFYGIASVTSPPFNGIPIGSVSGDDGEGDGTFWD